MTVDPAWVALSLLDHMGMTRLRALLDYFDNEPCAILKADEADLRQVPGIGKVIATAIRSINLRAVEAEISVWQAHGITLLPHDHADYPAVVRDLPDAPPTLFLRGKLDWLNQPAVAVVGTRSPSPVGDSAARDLGIALVKRGCIVVSGLALGVDASAHRGALIAEGTAVAVVGNGVNRVYPRENEKLTRQIISVERGGILSEAHPDSSPSPSRLVARNRIIAALSKAVIVVESKDDGGAMHAARRASELGRTVCTLDLPISGNQALIAAGAKTVAPGDLSAINF